LTFGLAAMISAQGWGGNRIPPRLPAAEAVTVSGGLVVAHGLPALKSGDDTYILGGINRLIGFIDGFKEGAQVTVEGSAFTSPKDKTMKFLRASKLTVNNKTYDLIPPKRMQGMEPRLGPPAAPRNLPRRPNPRGNNSHNRQHQFGQRNFLRPNNHR